MMDPSTARHELEVRRAYVTESMRTAWLLGRFAKRWTLACRDRLFAALSGWLIGLGTWLRRRVPLEKTGV